MKKAKQIDETAKQIEEAAKRYVEERRSCGMESEIMLDEVEAAFIEGAEHAVGKARKVWNAAFRLGAMFAAFPWHKVDAPVQPEMLENYLCYDGHGYFVAYKDGNDWFDTNEGNKVTPVAWCKFIHAPQD